MANPLQKAVVRRQILYVAAIIGLLTLSNFVRGKFSLTDDLGIADANTVDEILEARRVDEPAPASASFVDRIASRTLLAQSSRESLDLREVEQGDAEVDSAFFRLALTGSRGFAVTVLWKLAQEYQKRNEYHKLEQTVNAVTRLQPNFTTPWLYQSWNIAYNVSVENDRMTDMYYFIARGIELLAKGERLNRNSPDMRYYVAFYYQNKFSVHDKVTTLRSMMQLSTIPPSQRHPDRFRDPVTKEMTAEHLRNFKDFVEKNPRLARRLSINPNLDEIYKKKDPPDIAGVIKFLEDNYRVPSRFDRDRNDRLLNPNDQFPVLPPVDWGTRLLGGKKVPVEVDEVNSGKKDFDDTFDAFLAARSWFRYSTVVLPDPEKEPTGFKALTQKEKFLYRIPKAPIMIIFRAGAMRAQTYYGEFLQKEGWFDTTTEWLPQRWLPEYAKKARLAFLGTSGNFDSEDSSACPKEWSDADREKAAREMPDKDWAKQKDKWAWKPLKTPANSVDAWKLAHRMWEDHGVANGLVESPKFPEYRELAATLPGEDRIFMMDDEQLRRIGVDPKAVRARNILRMYEMNMKHTNYHYFRTVSEVESKPETARAKSKVYDAEQLAKVDDPTAAYVYARALAEWRNILGDPRHKDYSRADRPEEDSYETELKLVQLIERETEFETLAENGQKVLTALLKLRPMRGTPPKSYLTLRRNLAEREANLRMAAYHPDVVRRVDELVLNPVQQNDWPEMEVLWKELAKQAFLKSKPDAKEPEIKAALEDKKWRAEAAKVLAPQPAIDAAWPPPPQDDRNQAREKIARLVVKRELDWVPDYRSPVKIEENRWIRTATKDIIRDRLPKPTSAQSGKN